MQETVDPARMDPVPAPNRLRESAPRSTMAHAPVLSSLAVVASLASLAINRLLVRALNGAVAHPELVQLARWGTLARNLAGIACVGALLAMLVDLFRDGADIRARRRFMLGAFGAGSALAGLLAILLPAHRWNLAFLLVATATAHVLTVLFAATGAQSRSSAGLRASTGVLASSGLLALLSLVVAVVGPSVGWLEAPRAASALRRMGELLYLLLPLVLGIALFPAKGSKRRWLPPSAAAAVTLAVFALFLVARASLRAEFETLLYGTYRLELLLGAAPLLYAAPLSLGYGVGAMGLVSADGWARQAGTGLLLVLAAGYAPRTAGHLLMLAAGAGLLLRAVLARRDAPLAGLSEAPPRPLGSA